MATISYSDTDATVINSGSVTQIYFGTDFESLSSDYDGYQVFFGSIDFSRTIYVAPDPTVPDLVSDDLLEPDSLGEAIIFGGWGDDTVVGTFAGADTLVGGSGDDSMQGFDNRDVIYGDYANAPSYQGTDTDPPITLPDEDPTLTGNDTIEGAAGGDTIYGGPGDDIIRGGETNTEGMDGGVASGNDYLLGEDGNDVLNGRDGSDTLDGGAGEDILRLQMNENDRDSMTGGDGGDAFILSYQPPEIIASYTDDTGLGVSSEEAIQLGRYGVKTLVSTASAFGAIPGPVGSAINATIDFGATIATILNHSGIADSDETIPSAQDNNYNYVNITDFDPREDYILLPLPQISGNLSFDIVQSDTGWSILVDDGDQQIANISIDNDFLRSDVDDPTSAVLGGQDAAGVLEAFIENAIIVENDTDGDITFKQRRDGSFSDANGDGTYTQSDVGSEITIASGDSAEVSDLSTQLGTGSVLAFGNWGGQALAGDGSGYVRGTDDNDAIVAYSYAEFVDALENGFDPYSISQGATALEGFGGDDGLYGGDEDETLDGGAGNDYLAAGAGSDTLIGASGTDNFYIDHLNIPQSVSDATFQENTIVDLELYETIIFDATYTDTNNRVVTLNPDDIEFALSGSTDNIIIRFASESFPITGGPGVVIGNLNQVNVNNNSDQTLTSLLIDLDSATTSSVFGGNRYNAPGFTVAYSSDQSQIYVTRNAGVGTEGDDTIELSSEFVEIGYNYQGLGGNDRILGSHQSDTLDGGSGNDFIIGNLGRNEITGGSGNDTLLGGWDDDTVYGTSGLNTIDASAGDDSVFGGTNNDKIVVGIGEDTIDGGTGNDTFEFSNDYDGTVLSATVDFSTETLTVFTNLGAPDLNTVGQSYDQTFTSVEGTDGGIYDLTIIGSDGGDSLLGGSEQDSITGGDGDDTLDGGSGDDTLKGEVGADTLLGSDGNDSLIGGEGLDSLDGGDGNDTLIAGDDTLDAASDTYDPGDEGESLYGGSGNDSLIGGDAADTLYGGQDDDVIDAGGGNDLLYAFGTDPGLSSGDDVLNGQDGDDTIDGGIGNATVSGGAGDDVLIVSGVLSFSADGTTTSATKVIDGGADTDTLDLASDGVRSVSGFEIGVVLDLGAGTGRFEIADPTVTINGDYGFTISNVEMVIGTNVADSITGSASDDSIAAGIGDDTIFASFGDDTLDGGSGTNTLDFTGSGLITTDTFLTNEGGTATLVDADGNEHTLTYSNFERFVGFEGGIQVNGTNDRDSLVGGDGPDVIMALDSEDTVDGGAGGDSIDGGEGNDSLAGGDGNDTILGGDNSFDIGNDDTIDGGDGDDSILAGLGDDSVTGDDGSDTLLGGDGDDTIDGGDGADSIIGGDGRDSITAGAGNDTILSGTGGSSGGDDVSAGSGNDAILWFVGDANRFQTIDGGDDVDRLIINMEDGFDIEENTIDIEVISSALDPIGNRVGTLNISASSYATSNPSSWTTETFQATGIEEVFIIADANGTYVETENPLNVDLVVASLDAITGTDDPEELTGTDADELISALGGDDTVVASLGYDIADGGDGTDQLRLDTPDFAGGVDLDVSAGQVSSVTNPETKTYFEAFESYVATDSADTIVGSDDGEEIVAGGGDDSIDAGDGDDTISAVDGADPNNDGANVIDGGNGDDSIQAGTGSDTINGGAGNDTILSGTGSDTINGGVGNDTITVLGTNTVDGGDGDDSIAASGTFTANSIEGGAGNDTLAGLGNDTLDGGDGDDTLLINVGDAENVSLLGGSSIDTVTINLEPQPNSSSAEADLFVGTDQIEIDLEIQGTQFEDGVAYAEEVEAFVFNATDTTESDFTSVRIESITSSTTLALERATYNGGDGWDSFDISGLGGVTVDTTISGAGGDDSLFGGIASDVIDGGAGNDSIAGVAGEDFFTWSYGDGNDTIIGGDDTDTLTMNADDGIDSVVSGTTVDIAVTSATDAKLNITVGGDTLEVSEVEEIVIDADVNGTTTNVSGSLSDAGVALNTVTFNGNAGDDVYDGSGMTDLVGVDLDGGRGDDTLIGGRGDDVIRGGDGNDVKYGGEGADTFVGTFEEFVDGGAIGDFADAERLIVEDYDQHVAFGDTEHGKTELMLDLDGDGSADAIIDLEGDFAVPELDRFVIETVGRDTHISLAANVSDTQITDGGPGTSGNDAIYGSNLADTLWGQSGDDTLDGNGGSDALKGGSGDDVLRGEDGDDSILGESGNDFIDGGNGNDRIHGHSGDDRIEAEMGDDSVHGGDGDDLVEGGMGEDRIRGGTGRDTLEGDRGDDRIHGGDGNDLIVGGDGADTLRGNDGHDTIEGSDGDDVVHGGEGADVISGGAGADSLRGQQGDDSLEGNDGSDWMNGQDGNDVLIGGAGGDYIRGGSGDDEVQGEDGSDRLFGNTGDDVISGGAGADSMFGGSGDDELAGDSGADLLVGMSGNDTLNGGTGADTLIGGTGADIFVFATGTGADVVEDFSIGEDFIGLAGGLSFADINFDGNDILTDGDVLATLAGVQTASLTQDDFILL